MKRFLHRKSNKLRGFVFETDTPTSKNPENSLPSVFETSNPAQRDEQPIKAICPEHNDVMVAPSNMIVLAYSTTQDCQYRYACPEGDHYVIKPALPRIVDLLISAGVTVVTINTDVSEDLRNHTRIIEELGPMTTNETLNIFNDIQGIDINFDQ